MTSPTHSKSQACLQRGIFDGLKSFRELEVRISALATAHERGAAFEVFTEAYLATLAVEKAKAIWPGSRITPTLRKRLALPSDDMGVDGIMETQLGELHAYQAKFRSGRPSLNWSELSTFIGLADRADARVLVTNCDTFAGVVGERARFYAITGNDLDKLTPTDFAAIRTWLAGGKVERTRKTPLPHQAEALDHILAALRDHDRATALMACGTGKTLVALWVAEKVTQALLPASQNTQAGVPAPRILVLVPSLALLRQTLHEWTRETSWPALAPLCVCSDPSVKAGGDDIVLRPSDLDFPVTTERAQVRAFLAAPFAGVKLVFSTYQSAHVVAAGMKRGDTFDLALFDEAHKTAGREGVHFGFALTDKNLPIRQRLFLTATPRHYDVRHRDREGDARLVYSMDAPEIYGPVAHQLTFAEAARRGIICRYKVVVSVVTSEMVNAHVLRHGEVIVKGDAVKARHVANQLALRAAVEKHGVGKIFTFHRSVASAAAFTGDGPEGIGNHLPGFTACHVNGAMPAAGREAVLREFRAAPRAVISNAKCLTEGVDVPAVDMVAFLTPKRSRVDIVQATGRAMRQSPGKTTGYVLIPLFVEQAKGETLEAALARTEFDEVWNVLQAMQEQDDTLAEIIRQMREERGRTKGFDDTRFRETVEFLGPQISLEALRDCITTSCVEVLGDNWDERYGELKAFKERFGHCNVEHLWPENPRLGMWVATQRRAKRTGQLSGERERRLDQLGFSWNPIVAVWEKMFVRLVEYRRKNCHCNVPHLWPQDQQLGKWVAVQRRFRKEDKLSTARIVRLDKIGFCWNLTDSAWEEVFTALIEYKRVHKDCNVPAKWPDNLKLGQWVDRQRQEQRQGMLEESRRVRLDSIGFGWSVLGDNWGRMFQSLVLYRKEHGNCNVPKDWPHDRQLARWVIKQRSHRKQNQLSVERIRQLEEIDFMWETRDTKWNEMFAALVQYKELHSDCNVPAEYEENPHLARWVKKQRQRHNSCTLDDDRTRRLTEIGFAWDVHGAKWDEMFDTLVAYKERNGDCRVPSKCADNLQLARWVGKQRRRHALLSKERRERLNAIDFEW